MKFVCNFKCDTRCIHDFFVMTFGFDIDSTPAHSAARARSRREISNCRNSNFTGNGRVKENQRYHHFINDLQMKQVFLNVYGTIEIP